MIIIIGETGKKIRICQKNFACVDTILLNDKVSQTIKYASIKNIKSTSNVKLIISARPDDNIAYLFFDKKPAKTNNNEYVADKIPTKNKLYSTSHIDKLGPHTKFAQNK